MARLLHILLHMKTINDLLDQVDLTKEEQNKFEWLMLKLEHKQWKEENGYQDGRWPYAKGDIK